MKFINLRGCNGSGKTTLLRSLARHPDCKVIYVKPDFHAEIPVTITPDGLAILGDYTPRTAGVTTAGCDRIKTQAATKQALELIAKRIGYDVNVIIFEGIVVSTIYGPWSEWAEANGGMIWAFLNTPLDVCLKRIQDRNGGKPVKEDQIEGKHRTILRVREKALNDLWLIADIEWTVALKDIKTVIEATPTAVCQHYCGE